MTAQTGRQLAHPLRSKRRLTALALALALTTATAFGLASSHRADATTQYTVGVSLPFLFSPTAVVEANGLVAAGKAAGLRMLQPTNANNDSGQQITDVRNLIAAGAQGLLIFANDSQAIIPALTYAQQHKVKVVAVDVAPGGGHVAVIVRADNIGMGTIACQQMGKLTGGSGKVLSLDGASTSINGLQRTAGFVSCMKKSYPKITVIQKATNWDSATQVADVQTILTANPDLKGIYQQADYALSATLAVPKNLHHAALAGQKGHVVEISIDGSPLGLSLIKGGVLDAEVSQPINYYIQYGVQDIIAALHGKTFHAGPSGHGTTIINFDGNPEDVVPATLVTKQNISSPSLWANQCKNSKYCG